MISDEEPKLKRRKTRNNFDTLFLPNFMSGKRIPFKIAINEWYILHLISPKIGTEHSMSYEIYEKVAEEEKRYLSRELIDMKVLTADEMADMMVREPMAFHFSFEAMTYAMKKLYLSEGVKF